MDEQVDIVDENLNVIGTISKHEAHRNGTLHATVIAQVRDAAGNWTFVRQSDDRQDPGCFVCPVGGHVSAGETEEEALKREALEEIGLSDFEYKRLGHVIYDRKVLGRHENHYFIVFEIYANPADIVLGQEAVEHQTFSKEQLALALRETPELFGISFNPILENFYPELLKG